MGAVLERETRLVAEIAIEERVTAPLSLCQPPLQRTIALLRASLSSYVLVRYVGNKHAKTHPVVGILLVQPGEKVALVKSDVRRAGLRPYSPHWRLIRDYFRLVETDFHLDEAADVPADSRITSEALGASDLADEGRAWQTLRPIWWRILAFSPVYTALGDPHALIDQLFEEQDMSNRLLAAVEPEEGAAHEEVSSSSSLCHTIAHLAPHMRLHDVEVFMQLLAEQADEDAYPTMVTLLRRTIDLVTKRAEPAQVARVERILLASERVCKF